LITGSSLVADICSGITTTILVLKSVVATGRELVSTKDIVWVGAYWINGRDDANETPLELIGLAWSLSSVIIWLAARI